MSKSTVLKKMTLKANLEQVKAAEVAKYLEGERIKQDPGDEFLSKWFEVHSKPFRKKWSIKDCRETLGQMKIIRKYIRTRLAEVNRYTKELENLEEELLIDVSSLEKEMEENGKGDKP